MHPVTHLLVTVLTSIALSLLVLRILSGPLARLLARLCPGEAAAAFWLGYTQVMLTIAPLLIALVVDGWAGADRPLAALRLTLMAVLVGLLLGLHLVGRRLAAFVPSSATGAGEAVS
jgi:predicted tellurium resistance membrane protein TerC